MPRKEDFLMVFVIFVVLLVFGGLTGGL